MILYDYRWFKYDFNLRILSIATQHKWKTVCLHFTFIHERSANTRIHKDNAESNSRQTQHTSVSQLLQMQQNLQREAF